MTGIQDELDAAIAQLPGLHAHIEPRAMALTLIRTADWTWCLPRASDPAIKPLIAAGIPLLLRTIATDVLSARGWPPVASTPYLEKFGLSLAVRAGKLAICDRAIRLASTGLGTVTNSDNNYLIEWRPERFDMERWDVRDDVDFKRFLRANPSRLDILSEQRLAHLSSRVPSLLRRLVSPWRGDFIRYDAHPVLDEYYLHLARMHCDYQTRMADTFDPDATFGGVPFAVHRGVILCLVFLALKHLAFATALLEKRPSMRPPNVLTIIDDIPKLTSSIISTTDGSFAADAIREALQCVTWNGSNESKLSIPGENVAPLVQIGDNFVMRSISGALDQPFFYLLKKLRNRHRRDWDVAVNRREAPFRRDLEALFQGNRFLLGSAPAVLKENGKVVTDIDAAVYDRLTGTLAVFQLKWQDPLGNVVNERWSRANNFLTTGNAWLEKIRPGVAPARRSQLLRALKMPEIPIHEVLVFVLARTHASFSGQLAYGDEAAWGNWPQFARAASDMPEDGNRLSNVHRTLRRQSCERSQGQVVMTPHELDLGEFRVTISTPIYAEARDG